MLRDGELVRLLLLLSLLSQLYSQGRSTSGTTLRLLTASAVILTSGHSQSAIGLPTRQHHRVHGMGSVLTSITSPADRAIASSGQTTEQLTPPLVLTSTSPQPAYKDPVVTITTV